MAGVYGIRIWCDAGKACSSDGFDRPSARGYGGAVECSGVFLGGCPKTADGKQFSDTLPGRDGETSHLQDSIFYATITIELRHFGR